MHNFFLRFPPFLFLSIICFTFLSNNSLNAQKRAEYDIIQRERLQSLSSELRLMQRNERIRAHVYAMAKGIPLQKESDDGTIWYLEYIDRKGFPVYQAEDNAEAAITVGTDKLHPGGEIGTELEKMGIELTGEGFYVAMWEPNESGTGHPEIVGRVFVKHDPEDVRGPSAHATAVACNIAAAGINPDAKGMAYKTEVHTRNTRVDWIAEMAEAAVEGLLVSNCSFGRVIGWRGGEWSGDPSAYYDYRMGYYSEDRSRPLDQIHFEAPYYLQVWSAGNYRDGDGPGHAPNGPWNCIGPEKVVKNNLVIGNVQKIPGGYTGPEDVILSSSSSTGPTDDGRVKPDIVAPGVSIFTCGEEGYGTRSGTSRSAPIAAGSLLLLQQLHYELYGGPMRSATLRGLSIHTTKQAGPSKGPDFEFGWGLLDVAGAAEVLLGNDGLSNFVKELTLDDGEVYEFEFFARGNEDITATIAWTDPPGEPVPPQLNAPDLMLINDLDMRIYDELGNVYYPWRLEPDVLPLDPYNPPLIAERGDNYRDNVEKILIENPPAGKYRVEITHKGSLENDHQDFSLILNTAGLPVSEQHLFWVGGSGGWDDPSNWSSVSGGDPAGFIPDFQTTVIFDENSFEERGHTVSLSSDAECYNLLWDNENMHDIDFAGDNHLSVYNSLYIQSDSLLFSGPGVVIFKGEEGLISMGDLHEATAVFRFSNDNGSWEMASDARISALVMESGSLDASDIMLEVRDVVVEALDDADIVGIDFRSSLVAGLHSFIIERGIADIDFTGSVLEFSPGEGEGGVVISDGLVFNELLLVNGSLAVQGNNSFEHLTSFASLSLLGSNSINYLDLKPGSGLYIEGGSQQDVNAGISIESDMASMVLIHSLSAEESALFSVNQYKKYCFDYIHVYNVEAMGEAVLVAEGNSIMEGITDGWREDDCDNVLFAEFDVDYPCAGSRTFFIDRSSGNPDSWLWHFGDPGNSQSDDRNPHFTYDAAGLYTVLLEVESSLESQSRQRDIDVIENTLEETQVHVIGQIRYMSTRTAPNYQWFYEGEPIAVATSRFFENNDGLTGVFNVMIMDDQCNRLSDDLVVGVADLNQVDIYPNPFSESIFVEVSGPFMGDFTIEIETETGETVFSQEYTKSSEEYLVTIPAQEYSPGVYYVRVIFEDGEYEEMLEKEESVLPEGINVFPNPFSDNIYVSLTGDEMGSFSVEIVTVSGRTVFTREYTKTSQEQLVTIPASEYSTGIYLVRIKFGDERQVERIVKH